MELGEPGELSVLYWKFVKLAESSESSILFWKHAGLDGLCLSLICVRNQVDGVYLRIGRHSRNIFVFSVFLFFFKFAG